MPGYPAVMSEPTPRTSAQADLAATISDLLRDSSLDETERGLVRAALNGESALRQELENPGALSEAASMQASGQEQREVFLKSLTVSGFRGIGPPSRMELQACPGLTIVEGPNGSGKSSFAEALELLLTDRTARLAKRKGSWLTGWPNVHNSGGAEIEAELAISGSSDPHVVRRTWDPGPIATAPTSDVVVAGSQELGPVARQEWAASASTWRPFLVPADLAGIAERPSALFDVMYDALGLTALTAAEDELSAVKQAFSSERKALRKDLQKLLDRLSVSEDERAAVCHAALTADEWDLDLVGGVLQPETDGRTGAVGTLQSLSTLMVPEEGVIVAVAQHLNQTNQQVARFDTAETQRKIAVKALLEQALALHQEHDGLPCPVCGARRLDENWRQETNEEVQNLSQETEEALSAAEALATAMVEAKGLIEPAPPVLSRASSADLDAAPTAEAWRSWSSLLEVASATELADQIVARHAPLSRAISGLRDAARVKLDLVEQSWRPLAQDLSEWLRRAQRDAEIAASEERLSRAEDWIKTEGSALSYRRFEPIGLDMSATYGRLAGGDGTALLAPELAGFKARRRIELAFSLDGQKRAAAGVMSHGEANILALSVFLPRVAHDASPFRFLVIDDPVQAMDGLKIHGLARVLEDVARHRQVIVFTHDRRLAAVIRALEIDATHLKVVRSERSVVSCRQSSNAVDRHLDRAMEVLSGGLIDQARQVVVPGFLRQAIEAKCEDVLTRRRVRRGERYDDVVPLVRGDRSIKQWLSLAIFDIDEKPKDAARWIGDQLGPSAAKVVNDLNASVHANLDRSNTADDLDLQHLVDETRLIVDEIDRLA